MITKTISGIVTDPIYIGYRGENEGTQIYFDVPSDLAEYAYTVYIRRPREMTSYPVANIARSDDGNYIVWTVADVDLANAGTGEVQIRFTSDDVIIKSMVYPVLIGRAIDITTTDTPTWYDTWLDSLTALAESAHTDAEAAADSASDAYDSEVNAKASEDAAAESQVNAKSSEDNAKESEDNAKESENNASASASAADDSAEDAEAWAVGQRDGVDVTSGDETYENNAKYYAQLSADSGGFAWFSVDNSTGELSVTVTDSLASDVSFAVNTSDGTLEVTVS